MNEFLKIDLTKNCQQQCILKEECLKKSCDGHDYMCQAYRDFIFLLHESEIPSLSIASRPLKPGNEHDVKSFNDLKNIKNNILRFVSDHKNLYICSSHTGTGKTTWAVKILVNYICELSKREIGFEEAKCVFVHVPTFLMKMKNFENPLSEDYKEKIRNASLVVWDDIAAARMTETDISNLISFIDGRAFTKANIFTGNFVKKDDLAHVTNPPLADRIIGNSQIVTLTSSSMRGEN